MKAVLFWVIFLLFVFLYVYGFSQSHRASSPKANADAIWEFDSNDDVMPSVSGEVDPFFEVDTNYNIQPKALAYQQDANGDVEPSN